MALNLTFDGEDLLSYNGTMDEAGTTIVGTLRGADGETYAVTLTNA